jgi:hypothetical protein
LDNVSRPVRRPCKDLMNLSESSRSDLTVGPE